MTNKADLKKVIETFSAQHGKVEGSLAGGLLVVISKSE